MFISEISFPEAGLITVTKVIVSKDLYIASIYLSFLENKVEIENVLKIFKSNLNQIRFNLGKKLALKFVPQLRFYYDDSILYAQHINSLIEKVKKDVG